MANEFTLDLIMAIRSLPLDYRTHATAFRGDVTGKKGPTPGAIAVDANGVAIDLSELTEPGHAWFFNYSSTVIVDIGISDGTEFFPFGQLDPGFPGYFKLSKRLGRSIGVSDTGTGTFDGGTYDLYAKAVGPGNTANITVECFEA